MIDVIKNSVDDKFLLDTTVNLTNPCGYKEMIIKIHEIHLFSVNEDMRRNTQRRQ